MRIQTNPNQSYKSIDSLEPTDLPDFTVITGINGSGKSQLLEAIRGGVVSIDGIRYNSNTVKIYNGTNLVPANSQNVDPLQKEAERNQSWQKLQERSKGARDQCLQNCRNLGLDIQNIEELNELGIEEISQGITIKENASSLHSIIQSFHQNSSNQIITPSENNDKAWANSMRSIERNAEKPLATLTEDEFCDLHVKSWVAAVDTFQQSFATLFSSWHTRWCENFFNKFLSENGEETPFLAEPEFIERNGEAPWNFVNRILETSALNFQITYPKGHKKMPFQPKLIHQTNGVKLDFGDLSSGEKIIMSLTLCLYYAQDRRHLVNYPKILLFDEVDAPLHPSMTKNFLEVVKSELVENQGIKVIMTTHSPSTVALSPEESIFIMKGDGERLKKATKDNALRLLTSGIPTLSINYENRRQVFVESKYDVIAYETLFQHLTPICSVLNPEISLHFISSGSGGSGNCDQVKEIVSKLREGGSSSCYGIIDWDTNNGSSQNVFVVGEHERYSLENSIFDPLVLSSFLLREVYQSRSKCGFSDDEKYAQISNFSNERLQALSLKQYPQSKKTVMMSMMLKRT